MSPMIQKRYTPNDLISIPGCSNYSPSYNTCYDSVWGDWGRWVLAGLVVLFFFLMFCCCALFSARRRRRTAAQPFYGTAWMAPPKYNDSQAQYGHYAPGPPAYGAPPQHHVYGQPPQQNYYPNRTDNFSPPPGPPPGHHQSYEMHPQQTGVVGAGPEPSTYGGAAVATPPPVHSKNPLASVFDRFKK